MFEKDPGVGQRRSAASARHAEAAREKPRRVTGLSPLNIYAVINYGVAFHSTHGGHVVINKPGARRFGETFSGRRFSALCVS